MVKRKVYIITQARIGSTRFPGKVLEQINGIPLLAIHLNRLKQSALADDIIVATTFETDADKIIDIAKRERVLFSQGSTTNVLDRFYQAGSRHQPDYVVRVTSDCPLIDPSLVDAVIRMTIDNDLDYGANILVEEFPDGQDVECIKWAALQKAWEEATLASDMEHVTPFIRKNIDKNGGTLFKGGHLVSPANYNFIRMTVDEPKDLDAIKKLIAVLGPDKNWQSYTDYIISNPGKFPNQNIIRNEGYLKSTENEK